MSLLHSITAVNERIRYDHEAKYVLANKQILARILRECVDDGNAWMNLKERIFPKSSMQSTTT